MSDRHVVLYDPLGLIEAELPLDRVRTRLSSPPCSRGRTQTSNPRGYEQIALQLTGHARAVASDVRRHAATLPKNDGRGALADVVLSEADGRLSAPLERTALRPEPCPPRTRSLHAAGSRHR